MSCFPWITGFLPFCSHPLQVTIESQVFFHPKILLAHIARSSSPSPPPGQYALSSSPAILSPPLFRCVVPLSIIPHFFIFLLSFLCFALLGPKQLSEGKVPDQQGETIPSDTMLPALQWRFRS